MGGVERSGDRDQSHAQPAGLYRGQRHRARSRRHLHRHLQRPPAEAGQGHVPLPGQGHVRFRRHALALSGLRPAPGQGRQERPLARLAAKAAYCDWSAPDQRAGRHHQLHHLRPRPPAACVRRRQGAWPSHRPARPQRRDAAGARRQELHARSGHVRDRRREGRRIARRHNGRRGHRLLADHYRRADRIGAVGRDQHRADRAQARHQFRRALPLRARRRSSIHVARPRARHPDGARSLRRHAVGDRGGRRPDAEGNHRRFSHE